VATPEFSWRPLGQLFVSKGLLSEERLEHALAEQAANGGRLGEKLVELGYVSSSALARLLAEQYGVEIAFDTGFGTGLRAELERRHVTNPPPGHGSRGDGDVPGLTLVEPVREPEQNNDLFSSLAGLEEQWAKLAAAEARIAALEDELEAMRRSAPRTLRTPPPSSASAPAGGAPS